MLRAWVAKCTSLWRCVCVCVSLSVFMFVSVSCVFDSFSFSLSLSLCACVCVLLHVSAPTLLCAFHSTEAQTESSPAFLMHQIRSGLTPRNSTEQKQIPTAIICTHGWTQCNQGERLVFLRSQTQMRIKMIFLVLCTDNTREKIGKKNALLSVIWILQRRTNTCTHKTHTRTKHVHTHTHEPFCTGPRLNPCR